MFGVHPNTHPIIKINTKEIPFAKSCTINVCRYIVLKVYRNVQAYILEAANRYLVVSARKAGKGDGDKENASRSNGPSKRE